MYSDFVVWYEAARALREGRELYFTAVTNSGWRNMNPPQMVVLMAPLAAPGESSVFCHGKALEAAQWS